jgi:hypothetical protein
MDDECLVTKRELLPHLTASLTGIKLPSDLQFLRRIQHSIKFRVYHYVWQFERHVTKEFDTNSQTPNFMLQRNIERAKPSLRANAFNRTSARPAAFWRVSLAGRLAASYRDVTERSLLIGRSSLSLSLARYAHIYEYIKFDSLCHNRILSFQGERYSGYLFAISLFLNISCLVHYV